MPSSLTERLRDEIRSRGPIPFPEFQEMALYDPEEGYYECPGRIGPEGDFITGASWHPAFARCLGRVLVALSGALGGRLRFLDAGCGEGQLLRFLSGSAPDSVSLTGVEASARRRALASSHLVSVPFFASVKEAGRSCGIVFAYELIDALPVRSLRVLEDGSLSERSVGLGPGGEFAWFETPCLDAEQIRQKFERRGVHFEAGQIFEVRPSAPEMLEALANALDEGILLVFDYGAPARALYGLARREGTLEAFIKHRVTRDVLSDPGSRDITAWVDFTEAEEALRASGLTVLPLMSQSRFLMTAGITHEIQPLPEGRTLTPVEFNERREILSLFAPGGMGESIRVLAASRGPFDLEGVLKRSSNIAF